MKMKLAATLIAMLAVSNMAVAQSKREKLKTKESIYYAKVAAIAASNSEWGSFVNLSKLITELYYVPSLGFDVGAALKFKFKADKPGNRVVLLLSEAGDKAISVYFDGDTAIGISAATAKNGKFDPAEIYANSQTVTKEMLAESGKEFQFDPIAFSASNGQKVSGFKVRIAAKAN